MGSNSHQDDHIDSTCTILNESDHEKSIPEAAVVTECVQANDSFTYVEYDEEDKENQPSLRRSMSANDLNIVADEIEVKNAQDNEKNLWLVK